MANKGCAINVAKAKERCLHETERILAILNHTSDKEKRISRNIYSLTNYFIFTKQFWLSYIMPIYLILCIIIFAFNSITF
jgi:flagellar biosynthesis regulator FlaF